MTAEGPASPTPVMPRAVLLLLAVAAILAFGVSRARLAKQRGFNPDELEHLHFSWLIAEGRAPYRDYFDHHGPLLHRIFAERLKRGVEDPVEAIIEARGVSLGFTLALLLVGSLALAVRAGPGAALVFVALLCSSANFIAKSLEFRPDVGAALFLSASVALAAEARWRTAGLVAGFSLLFTPKGLFSLAGVAASIIVTRARTRDGAWRPVAWFLAGLALPLMGAAIGLFRAGALEGAVRFAVIEAAKWKGPTPGPVFAEFVRTDWVIAALLVLAAPWILLRGSEASALARTAFLALCAGLGGLFLVTYPSRQYLLLIVPLAATLAADSWERGIRSFLPNDWRRAAAHITLAGAIAMAGISEHRRAFGRGNAAAIGGMEIITRNTDPREQVLDGFIGYAPLREHGTFFPFLHRDVRALRERTESPSLLESLQSGRLLPKFALMNHYLREGVDPQVWAFLEANYAPVTDDDEVRVRLFDNGLGFWRDTGPRSLTPTARHEPHVVVLTGWSGARQVEDRPGRWLVPGQGSYLMVPVRRPEAFDLSLNVIVTEPVTMDVELNGTALEAVALPAGAGVAVVRTEASMWRPGLNRMVLRVSSSRRVCFVSGLELRPSTPTR